MVREKLVNLVVLLHEKTQNGELKWRETPLENAFRTDFSDKSITIQRENKSIYTISIHNQEGVVVEEFNNDDLISLMDISHGNVHPYDVMSEIYNGARRQALGVEDTLDQLISSLSG